MTWDKMSEARIYQDELRCAVCMDVLKDPVTIPCGHSYCKSCITVCWDEEDQKRVYSCPQCRQTFSPRPALAKNTILAEMVKKLKKAQLPDDCYDLKMKGLKATQRMPQQRIQQREKDLQQLREALESHKRSAQTAVEDSERIFTELIRSIERSCSEATQRIRDQEKTAVSRAEGLLERLEQEISDLKRRDAELEQLSHTQDHIHLLQSFQSLSALPECTSILNMPFSSLSSFDGVRESVRQLRDKLEDFCKEELKKIPDRVTFTSIVPKTRNEFLEYTHRLTLDLNTAHKRLHLSEKNRVITETNKVQSYPDHPDRFDYWCQVLCRESVCDRRCYWEIEWSGLLGLYISVSYKSISRKGEGYECWFGHNDQSWSLFCSSFRFSFIHNKIETDLPVVSCCRIGVYVDYSAGILSFYSVSGDTMSLIHTVQTTFTQPLYPGFWVYHCRSRVKLCQ
ncbi:tripartite motif-containing protein 16-like protein isoform X2 [Ctenopharyngodon idella]|uniref:tripartite motif-containing protein 16-like protein isoform X2 n=1 Tax=Ctenopharyngodon idella TaxID=7959 RepID=UPI002231AE7E|nr:tripartite motif-containing protein 16-like protein isoform X2 [Ctenopharyngodon idella]